jgi:DNA-binding MarR family transcriptional regulator
MAEIRRPGSGRNSNVENQKNIFGAIPARAFPDARLAARHYKVLGAVAVHDRFGKNGQRCWAGRDRLAKLAGIAPNHVSDALGELEFYGYVKRQRHPMNRRTTIIRVLYSD